MLLRRADLLVGGERILLPNDLYPKYPKLPDGQCTKGVITAIWTDPVLRTVPGGFGTSKRIIKVWLDDDRHGDPYAAVELYDTDYVELLSS